MNENGNGDNLPFESRWVPPYMRVSSANQDSLPGMNGQWNAVQRFASEHGLEVVWCYEESDPGHGAEADS